METTGRPFTVKCFSNFWPAPNAAAGKKNTLAPITGSRVRFNLERLTVAGHMLVNAPSAIEHRGQQFRFLLISNREIFTSQLVVGIFLEATAAIFNELIERFQILAQGCVNNTLIGERACLLGDGNSLFELMQGLPGGTQRLSQRDRRRDRFDDGRNATR